MATVPNKATVPTLITQECDALKKFLLQKNKEYGNSAIEPLNIFCSASPEEQINARMDDKLKRMMTVKTLDKVEIQEDTELDLLGYLILKRVCKKVYGEKK